YFMGTVGNRLKFLKKNLSARLTVLRSSEPKPEKVQPPRASGKLAILGADPQHQRVNTKGEPVDLAEQAELASSAALDEKGDSVPQEGLPTSTSHQPPDSQTLSEVEQESSPTSVSHQPTEIKQESRSALDSPTPPLVPFTPSGWRENPIVINPGTTISEIVYKVYGNYNTLALDLIKEFNPHIENLNWVMAGEKLFTPPLTSETLLRKQPDDSYKLILASLSSSIGAADLAQGVRNKGYKAMVTPRRVSDTLLLHRVEIRGLENLEAVNQAWDSALENHWLPFAENAP
ncbi:MAG: hypothetical protein ACE5JO_02405, partial [Candidatus Binatia bacterium]